MINENIKMLTKNATHFNNRGWRNYTCLHSQCKIVKYWCSARLPFKKRVNLVIMNIKMLRRNATHLNNYGCRNYTCLHLQCKIVKYWCSARLPFEKRVNLVIMWGLLHFLGRKTIRHICALQWGNFFSGRFLIDLKGKMSILLNKYDIYTW